MFFLDRLLCRDVEFTLRVRGTLLDPDTLQEVADAAVGGRAFTDGERTESIRPSSLDGLASWSGGEDGSFELAFSDFGGVCQPPLDYRADFLLRTDQIEIIVVRSGCEQTFMIDIDEDTAVIDVDSPNGVIELKEPILVGPCEE